MLKLAQLKYPNFPTRVTPSQATVSLTSEPTVISLGKATQC